MQTITFAFVVSVISAVITGIFAVIVLRRWWEKRRLHNLAWGVGLALYFLGTFSQVVLSFVWSPVFFALWYWTGALMVAPWLGQGTIYLLWRKGNIDLMGFAAREGAAGVGDTIVASLLQRLVRACFSPCLPCQDCVKLFSRQS